MDNNNILPQDSGSQGAGTRERILKAAQELFTSGGFDAVSVREIAEAAGVNSAMIYYYFQDKEGLYRQVLAEVFGVLARRIQELARCEGRPEAVLRELARAYMEFLQTHQGCLRLMYQELARGAPNLPDLSRTFIQDSFAAVSRLIARGTEEGEFREIDPYLGVVSLLGALLFYFFGRPILSQLLGPGAYSQAAVEKYLNHTTSLYFYGLLKG